MIETIVGLILADPKAKSLLEGFGIWLLDKAEPLAVKAGEAAALRFAALFTHKGASDPQFVSKFQVVSAQVAAAKTDEDKANASKALHALMSS